MKHRWLVAGISLLGTCNTLQAVPQGEDLPAAVVPAAVPQPPDLSVKAAMIEVGWLSDPLTYPFRLRAEHKGDAIAVSGFVPNEMIREKAAAIARNASVGITLQDAIVVIPNMAMPVELTTEPSQKNLVRTLVDKAVPAIAKQVELMIDGTGVVTVGGRVDELSDRRKVIRALQAIPGCTCVKYDLRMSPSVLVTMPTTPKDLPLEPPPLPVLPTPPIVKPASSEQPVIIPSPLTSRTPPASMTSRTPPGSVQQVEHRTPTTPVIQVQPARTSEKASEHSFLIPSVSGLTPPGPAVTIGSPTKAFKPTYLGNGFVIPTAAEQGPPAPNKPPELQKLLPAPQLSDPPPFPFVPLPSGK
jgi:hypothetical protein